VPLGLGADATQQDRACEACRTHVFPPHCVVERSGSQSTYPAKKPRQRIAYESGVQSEGGCVSPTSSALTALRRAKSSSSGTCVTRTSWRQCRQNTAAWPATSINQGRTVGGSTQTRGRPHGSLGPRLALLWPRPASRVGRACQATEYHGFPEKTRDRRASRRRAWTSRVCSISSPCHADGRETTPCFTSVIIRLLQVHAPLPPLHGDFPRGGNDRPGTPLPLVNLSRLGVGIADAQATLPAAAR
jgi:hypothetical protein